MMSLEELKSKLVGRDASLLTEEQWRQVDTDVTAALRRMTNARIALAPIIKTGGGAGVKVLRHYKQGGRSAAKTDLDGEPEVYDLEDKDELLTKSVVHYAGWTVKWRDYEASLRAGTPLPTEGIESATREVALTEDAFAYLGASKYGVEGVLNQSGTLTQAATGSWATSGDNAYTTIDAAILQMEAAGVSVRPDSLRLLLNAQEVKSLRAPRAAKSGSALQDLIDAGIIGRNTVVHAPLQTAGTGTLMMADQTYQRWTLLEDVHAEELPRLAKSVRGWVYGVEALQFFEKKATVQLTGVA